MNRLCYLNQEKLLHDIPKSYSKVAQISKSCHQNLEKLLAL